MHTSLSFQLCCSESCLIFLVGGKTSPTWKVRGPRVLEAPDGGGQALLLHEMTYTYTHFHKSTPEKAPTLHCHGVRAAHPHTEKATPLMCHSQLR